MNINQIRSQVEMLPRHETQTEIQPDIEYGYPQSSHEMMPSIDAMRLQSSLRTAPIVQPKRQVQIVQQHQQEEERMTWKGVVYSMALGCAAFALPSLICIPFFSLGWIIPTALAGTSLLAFLVVGKGDNATRRIDNYLRSHAQTGGYI